MNLAEESMNESEVDWITHQKEKEEKKSIAKDNLNEKEKEEKKCITKDNPNVFRRSKTTIKSFPPPLTCFGPSGKPRVCFTAYRFDGRLILKENKLPKEGFLHASREDGTLKIKLIKPDEEIPEEEEEEEKEEEEEAKVDDDEKEDEEI